MAVNPIYRESWQKANGWNVRVEFIGAGGEASKHDDRSVTDINGVFKDVSSHKASFSDGIPFGLADAEACSFIVDYTAAPAGMQSALVAQFASVADGNFAELTVNKYRTPKYMPQAVSSVKPKQPNLFMVWSDRGTSNGVVTGLTIAYGGTAWASNGTNVATDPYFPAPMDTRIGSGLRIDYTVSAGAITTVTVASGGTGYKVGQQVKIEDPVVPGRYAYFTVSSVQAPTWYIEFMGCQRISPSTKYKVDERGMDIEFEAIGIHKIALESITDLTTYTRSYTDSDSTTSGNYYFGIRSTKDITDFDYVYSKTRYTMEANTTLLHWHAPLGSLFDYMNRAFQESFEFFSMEGYQGATVNEQRSNLYGVKSGVYPSTTSNLKLMRQALFSDYLTNVQLGQTNGTLHDTEAELTEIRFIFCVTRDDRTDYQNPDAWAGGLFTDFEDGIRKDCDSAWDLLKKLAEQFFLKMTPYYEFADGVAKAKWNVTEVYGSISGYGVPTLEYDATVGDAAFEANAETRETVKQHYAVTGNDVDSVEVTSYTKSGKKIECNHIFDIRVRTAPDGTDFIFEPGFPDPFTMRRNLVQIPYARLRGLYFMKSPQIGTSSAALVAVSPRITLSFILNGTTQLTAVSENVYAQTSDVKDPNYILHNPNFTTRTADVYMVRIRELQESSVNGFGLAAIVLAYYFGVPADPTDPNSSSQFESNNQTAYEMELPLSTARLPERLGQRVDITPHPALSTAISEKAYLIDLDVDWTARDSKSDYVNAKYLTRNIKFD